MTTTQSLPVRTLPVGRHSIIAYYDGDAFWQPASAHAVLTLPSRVTQDVWLTVSAGQPKRRASD